MADRVVAASEFKARCLAMLDRVAETGESIVITKHGRAVAQVVPLESSTERRSLEGSVTILCSDEELIGFRTGPWDAEEGILVRE